MILFLLRALVSNICSPMHCMSSNNLAWINKISEYTPDHGFTNFYGLRYLKINYWAFLQWLGKYHGTFRYFFFTKSWSSPPILVLPGTFELVLLISMPSDFLRWGVPNFSNHYKISQTTKLVLTAKICRYGIYRTIAADHLLLLLPTMMVPCKHIHTTFLTEHAVAMN
jgi:hypothetical protein